MNEPYFCIDLLYIYRYLQVVSNKNEIIQFVDRAAMYFLVQQGFTSDDVKEAEKDFAGLVQRYHLLGDVDDPVSRDVDESISRVVRHIEGDDWLKSFIISSMRAIIEIQPFKMISRDQVDLIESFRELFDMTPADYQKAIKRGADWGYFLINVVRDFVSVADEYSEYDEETEYDGLPF